MRARHLICLSALFVATTCINGFVLNGYKESQDNVVRSRRSQSTDNGAPWPLPQHYNTSKKFKVLDTLDFEFSVEGFTCDILDQAFSRYYKIIFDKKPKVSRFSPTANGKLSDLKVNLQNPCEYLPTLESDESYSLVVDDKTSRLEAKSIWGVLRGLETFSQLIHKIDGRLAVRYTWISDFPRFSWRGILLDSARHFLPLKTIFNSLDAMAYNKINVFHWHIVDDQSFPYVSSKFPNLSLKGAYRQYSHTYTQDEVAQVIEYARMRGIRVVVEFDTPGHMQSWKHGQPDLLTTCYTSEGKPSKSRGPIDPSKNSTYDFIREFFTEVSEVFPDQYVHLGGDEVSFSCWRSNPLIREFMEKIQIGDDYAKLESYYVERLLEIVHKLKKNYIVWQEVFDNNLKIDPSTVVHLWKGDYKTGLKRVTSAGYKAILSKSWYLDYYRYGDSWTAYYAVDPRQFGGTDHEMSLVIGGEACLWGELVDSTNIHSRLWPAASAIAERLWSHQSVTNVESARKRLDEHRCRMIKRGIMAGPASSKGYCETEAVL